MYLRMSGMGEESEGQKLPRAIGKECREGYTQLKDGSCALLSFKEEESEEARLAINEDYFTQLLRMTAGGESKKSGGSPLIWIGLGLGLAGLALLAYSRGRK